MRITLVSFYTDDDYYRPHGRRLQKECDALGVPHEIIPKPSAGGYLANTRIKPFAIRELLMKVGGPVLWVDVDASVLKPLTWLQQNANGSDFGARPMPEGRIRKWHVGTLYFRHSPPALTLLNRWCDATASSASDEGALDKIIGSTPVLPLPASYFHLPGKNKPAPKDTVILHRLSTVSDKMARKHEIKAQLLASKS